MATAVADRSSNKNEQIVHAAEVIGRSKHRAAVFRAIYTKKSKSKSVEQLMNSTGLSRMRVLQVGLALSSNDLVVQKKNGSTTYEKVAFIGWYRDKILQLASNPKARQAVPTKRNPSRNNEVRIALDVRLPKRKVRARHITIDDIDSFSRVRAIPHDLAHVKIPETTFKDGVGKILGEKGSFKDWGGELRDLSSTRLVLKGRRRAAAFAFKGPGKSGSLTPAKMGKNGDQIQRLTKCPAEIFVVQYWAEISDGVLEQLEKLIQLKAYFEDRELAYCIIDGQDSARIIRAYPACFPSRFR
jgi:hypothetical protein